MAPRGQKKIAANKGFLSHQLVAIYTPIETQRRTIENCSSNPNPRAASSTPLAFNVIEKLRIVAAVSHAE
jgi:hypothetical protein